MKTFEVEVHTLVKEVYWVNATSEEEARENWHNGHLGLSDAIDAEVVDVLEVDKSWL